MGDPAVHAIETFLLTTATAAVVLMLLTVLACIWTDREYVTGRDDRGTVTPRRDIRRQP